MQFSLISFVAAFAGVAMATPIPLHQIRACDVATCAIALGPTAVGCTGAAVEVGANPIADAGCISGVLNSVINAPAACAGCKSGVTGRADNAGDLVVLDPQTFEF